MGTVKHVYSFISFISFVSLGGDAEAQSAVPRDDPPSKAAGPGLE
jgi:hypothetical protein